MLAFCHIEKCAGTSWIYSLRRNFQVDHFDVIPNDKKSMILSRKDLNEIRILNPNIKSISGHSIKVYSQISQVPNIYYYTILRNPIDRYLSDYQHLGAKTTG